MANEFIDDATEQVMRLLAEATIPALISRVADGVILQVNDPLMELTRDESPERGLGRSFKELLRPDDLEKVARNIEALLSGRPLDEDLTYHILRADGTYGAVEIHSVVTGFLGEPTLLSVLLDRTPVAEAESRVRLSEERFTRLFDASPTGFMLEALEDGVLRFDAFNPSIESIFGIRAADWVGRPHRELFSSDRTIPIVAACVDVARDGGLRRWPAEPVDSLPGKRFFDIVAFQIEPNVVAVAVSDVTNNIREHQELLEHRDHLEDLVSKRTQELEDAYESLEAVNESLREATAAKDQFVASMNHELRTPLNSIIGFSSIMLDGLAGEINEEQQRQLQMIRSSGRQLLSLVGNVLDFAKIEHEGGGVDIARIVPGSLVLRVSEMVRPLAEDKGLELIADVSRAPKEMWTDERKLEQALVNLLSNAIKYTEKGSVTIELESCGDDGVRFSVGDTGVGIPADQLDYVFQEFAQIPQRGAGRPQGSGLGLAITKRLVDSLKGEISLSSETGRGSTFVIHLPLAYPIEIE